MSGERTQRAILVLCTALLAACRGFGHGDARAPIDVVRGATRSELSAFESERELRSFLRDLGRAQERERAGSGAKASCVPETCESLGVSCGVHPDGCGGTVSCGACSSAAEAPAAEEAAPAPATAEAPSITNVQHAGVDEGSIVKLRKQHLIVLRRGRLFSIDLGAGRLALVSSVDAYGPDVDPSATWYDELLVSDDTVVVIGYSYARGGTELVLFDIDGAGKLAHRATYHLRSNDYYSSRNYASRLIGNKLVFYAPLELHVESGDPFASFPALRKWQKRARPRHFRRTAEARRVYRPLVASSSLALHTVTSCELGARELDCSSSAVMGPAARVFYVSPDSVYVWVGQDGESIVYRLPLDGSTPTALGARGGSPVDQLSFLQSDDEHLNVVLRADAGGDSMWSAEVSAGDVALLRVPLDAFSSRVAKAERASYTRLPTPKGAAFQNRFVGEHVLYGTGHRGTLFVHRYASGRTSQVAKLPLGHGVDRIEALGSDAIVVGGDARDLHFSPIALGPRPWVAARYTRRGAAQAELRTHGFFYRNDAKRSGVLGLPIRHADSASVLFVQNRGLALGELGALAAEHAAAQDDDCRASCVDWYGNARPLFVGERIFALLGYEVVEGALVRGRIRERRRLSFAPQSRLP